MTYNFVITPSASQDLNSIKNFIETDNFFTAQKVIMHITKTVRTIIANNPHIGRHGKVLRTREFILTKYPYKIVYTVKENELVILRVLHTSRKW